MEIQYIFATKNVIFINFFTVKVATMMSLDELQMSFVLSHATKIPRIVDFDSEKGYEDEIRIFILPRIH